MDKNISATISSAGESVVNWACEWSATVNSRAHQALSAVVEEGKALGTNVVAAAEIATHKVEVLASDAATYVGAHEGPAIAIGVTAGLIGLDILTRGRTDKVTQLLRGVSRPSWEKQAEQLTLLKRYPTSELDVSSGLRLSWHSKPVLDDKPGSAWITRTTETNPNTAEMVKTSGASFGAGLSGPTFGAVAKGLEQVGVASKGKIIEKMNEQTGDYIRIKESSGLSFKVGPLAYESPRTSTFAEYQLGEAWKHDKKGGAFVRVTKSDSRSGHQYTSIEFTTEEGQHRRHAWGNREGGVHTRIDTDLTRNNLTFVQRDGSGAVTDKVVLPRTSPFHMLARVNRQILMNRLEGTQVSDAALTRLLSTHVLADDKLLERL